MRNDVDGQDSESAFVKHVPCESCGSSDANSLYTDGHQFCFACDAFVPGEGGEAREVKHAAGILTFKANEGRFVGHAKRKLTEDTCRRWSYWVAKVDGEHVAIADYRDASGAIMGQKIRTQDKEFRTTGKIGNDLLYGAHLWSGRGKMIVVTEGEIDAMSVSQLQDHKWPVVSLPCGAKAAKKSMAANYEYLDGYEKIILMFDNDEPGRSAVKECCEVLPMGKVFVAQLPLKDANACLQEGMGGEVLKAIWNAAPYRPDGVVSARDVRQEAMKVSDAPRIEWPLGAKLQAATLGLGAGEVVMLTSGSGMGKSSFAREVCYGLGHLTGRKVGMAFIEESIGETLLDIMGLHLNKRIRQFPASVDASEKQRANDELFDNETYYLYDHFGSAEEDSLINKLRYMRLVAGCEVVVLDHLSIVVSGMEANEDERKTIDRIMTKLKTMAKATGVALICVVHLRRKDGKSKSHEEGGQISLSELRGSGAIAQLSDTVIGFERNQQGGHPNYVRIRILKCRFTGETGEAGWLFFDKETGRLLESMGPPEDGNSSAPPQYGDHGDY